MTPQDALILQLLDWLAEKPRSYADVMDAWKTTCPRFTIWEDACDDGLVMKSKCGQFELSRKGCELRRRRVGDPAAK